MKDIYNMDKNLTVIRPKNTNLRQQWYLEKLSVLENVKFNPRETSPQIKIAKYGNHPLCNNFKIIIIKKNDYRNLPTQFR